MKTEQPEDENNAIPSENANDCSARNTQEQPATSEDIVVVNPPTPDLDDENRIIRDPVDGRILKSRSRPYRLTPDKFRTLIQLAGNWATQKDMANAIAVTTETLRDWVRKGQREAKKGQVYSKKQLEAWLKGKGKMPYRSRNLALWHEMEMAKAFKKDQLIIGLTVAAMGDIQNGKPPDGNLILKILERKYAEEWGIRPPDSQPQTIINDASQAKINVFIPQEKPLKEVPDEGEVK